jgi:hypothetical protein
MLWIYLAQRRNKWVCALKQTLAEVKIFGPEGDPNSKPDTKRYTIVPWEEVQEEERKTAFKAVVEIEEEPLAPAGGWRLSDKNAVIRACHFFACWLFRIGKCDPELFQWTTQKMCLSTQTE